MDLETRVVNLECANRRLRLVLSGVLLIGVAGVGVAASSPRQAGDRYSALTVDINSGVTRNGRRFVDLYRMKENGDVERGSQSARAWQWEPVN